jgi:hypothetical protein
MLNQARVKFQWAPLPTPQKIKRAQTKKARRTFHDLLTSVDTTMNNAVEGAPVPTANGVELDFEYAKRLLDHHNPERVIAVLLALSEARLPTEPRAIVEPPLLAEKPPAWQTHRHASGAQRPRGPYKPGFKTGGPRRAPGNPPPAAPHRPARHKAAPPPGRKFRERPQQD